MSTFHRDHGLATGPQQRDQAVAHLGTVLEERDDLHRRVSLLEEFMALARPLVTPEPLLN